MYLMPTEYLKVIKMAKFCYILPKFKKKNWGKKSNIKKLGANLTSETLIFSFFIWTYLLSWGFSSITKKMFSPLIEDFQIASCSKSRQKRFFGGHKSMWSRNWSVIDFKCKEIIFHPDWVKCYFLGILLIINDYLAKYTQFRVSHTVAES